MPAHLSSLSRSPWMTAALTWATALSFVSPANLFRVHCTSSSRSLMNIFNRTGPSIDPWDTLPLTGIQSGFALLTTALWAQTFSQFSIHLTASSAVSLWRPYRVSVKKPYWSQENNIHCSLLIHQISHFTIEAYQVGQVWLSLAESTMTTPDDDFFSPPRVSRMSCSISFQEVVTRSSLLPFSKIGVTFPFLYSSGTFPSGHYLRL